MGGKSEIAFVDFDPTSRAPRFRIDTGTNDHIRIDLATNGALFDNAAGRTPANFQAGASQAVSPGESVQTVPSASWNALETSGGRVYFRITTWRDTNTDYMRSVALGQGATAPSFSTVRPRTVQLADPFGRPLVLAEPVTYEIRDVANAVLQSGSLAPGELLTFDQPTTPHRINLRAGDMVYAFYFA